MHLSENEAMTTELKKRLIRGQIDEMDPKKFAKVYDHLVELLLNGQPNEETFPDGQ